jgi:predicted O-methyltransferase YrrM
MVVLERANQLTRAVGMSAVRRLAAPGIETIGSVRAAEPEWDAVRRRVLGAGSENREFFGTEFEFDGGMHLQQNADEFTALTLLLRRQEPRATYVEIGSASGGSCRFLQEEVGFGRILAMDDGQHPRTPEQKPNFAAIGNVTQWVGDSHSPDAKRFLAEWTARDPIDVAFIDADHSYEGVKQDVQMVVPRCRPGTLLVFHDTRSCPGVQRLWLELRARRLAKPIAEFVGEDPVLGIGVARVERVPRR